MSDYTEGGGCMFPIFLTALILFGLLLIGSAGGDHTSADTTPVLSGNEVFSRNQLNAFSDVTNNYLDCMGAYSCIVTDNSTVITNTATTNMSVDGDRNTVIQSDGQIACEDPNHPNQFGTSYCEEGQP